MVSTFFHLQGWGLYLKQEAPLFLYFCLIFVICLIITFSHFDIKCRKEGEGGMEQRGKVFEWINGWCVSCGGWFHLFGEWVELFSKLGSCFQDFSRKKPSSVNWNKQKLNWFYKSVTKIYQLCLFIVKCQGNFLVFS